MRVSDRVLNFARKKEARFQLNEPMLLCLSSQGATVKQPGDQSRDRERQRPSHDDERRSKLLVRKDHHPMLVPRFTPLTVDQNNEESRTNRSKSPTRPSAAPGALSPHLTFNNETTTTTGAAAAAKVPHKSSPNTPSTRNPITKTQDENIPSSNDTGPTLPAANALLTSMQKAVPVKKRSLNLVRPSIGRLAHSLHV